LDEELAGNGGPQDASRHNGVEGKESRGIAVFLAALVVVEAIVLAAHWPSLSAKAVMFDDDQYLVENRLVQRPSWSSAKQFFAEVFEPSTVRGYYQPLAMLSLMLDAAMGGGVDNVWVFHRTSLFLHVANSLLLVVFLYLLFGQIFPAAIAGLLYGVHPVTIGPVVWLSERKTVLAAFFAIWCLIFYVCYAHKGRWRYYAGFAAAYVLSLASKPSAVAIPVLMLLLDWWPLGRLSLLRRNGYKGRGRKIIAEKIPLFIIGGIVAVVTFVSQSSTASVKLPSQTGAAHVFFIFCHNMIFYLFNFLWPIHLSWYYPFPEPFNLSQPFVQVGVIGTFLLITALLISLRWSRCLLMGWMFFLAAIFPALGLIGIHPVIAADRHLYFPMIGFFLPITYFLSRLWAHKGRLKEPVKRIILVSAVMVAAAEFVLTRSYLGYWRDTETVYKYMLRQSPNVPILHNNLANVLKDSGRLEDAIEHGY